MNQIIPAGYSNEQKGSLDSSEPSLLAVGKLRRPHGINGEILMEVLTDFPERFVPGKAFYIGDNNVLLRVENIRSHNKGLIVSFEGIYSREKIEPYRNTYVKVRKDTLPELPEGDYYFHQLIGLIVVDETGKDIGILKEILETGANDVFIIKTSDGKEILLPATDEVILDIDLEDGLIKISLPVWK